MPDFICNTSPFQYLHQLGLLEVLPKLMGTIVIPPSVLDELQEGKVKGWDVPNLATHSWIEVRPPLSAPALPLAGDLGPGEAGVLALALESADPVVILDDQLAHRAAQLLHLPLTGTLGLLLDAKSKQLIPAVRPCLDNLTQLRFRVSDHTRQAILKLAKETSLI